MINFKKKTFIGVAVTPENGLEVAQVDFDTRCVLKYVNAPLVYDSRQRIITDLDTFKETLLDLLMAVGAPAGSEIAVSIPSVVFKINNYPANYDEQYLYSVIEEDLSNHTLFKNDRPGIALCGLKSESIQFNNIAYSAVQQQLLIEIACIIKELGHKLIAIDTSVTTSLNALFYSGRIEPIVANWLVLTIDNNACRILSMHDHNLIDFFEEIITIGEVLGDEENYSIVKEAINPLLSKLPAKCLYVVSKTNIIQAEKLAEMLDFKGQIIYQEGNCFNTVPHIDIAPEIEESLGKRVSFDVIGAAIYSSFESFSLVQFNLFNESLGYIYTQEQPPTIKIGQNTIKLTTENLIKIFMALSIVVVLVVVLSTAILTTLTKQNKEKIDQITQEIAKISAFIKKNKEVSSNIFDENDEIRTGLVTNKLIYSYFTIIGTETPKKLWLTKLDLGDYVTIEGQADNLESIFSFSKNIKEYNLKSDVKLQKLALASKSSSLKIDELESDDADLIMSNLNADFYEFSISNAPKSLDEKTEDKKILDIPELEAIE